MGLLYRVFESSALAAYAAHKLGREAERDHLLEKAASVDPPPINAAALRMLAMRLGSDRWRSWPLDPIARDPLLDADETLIRAREFQESGMTEPAREALRRARAEGVDQSHSCEEAELLAAELSEPAQVLPPDPPYPNILRYLAIFDLEASMRPAAHSITSGMGSER
jgi:hypothetical protein